MIQISIIIVNYNVKYFLEECLNSVLQATKNLNVEIFVVDNNSVDGSVEWIKQKFNSVIIIENKINVGFAKANNQALEQARGKYIVFLNPDTVVQENTFTTCISFYENENNVGGIGVKMIDGTGKFLPESKRGFPSPWVAFCKMVGLSRVFNRSKLFAGYHLGYLPNDKNNKVPILAGAFMFIKKSILDTIGGFDEQFFMYGEDIDLSYRIELAGYSNYYVADTQIIHYKGESTKKGSLNYVKMFYQAMIIFAQKHFSKKDAVNYTSILKIAIYFKALSSFIYNSLKNVFPVILDASLIYSGLYALKVFWEVKVKHYGINAYPAYYYLIIFPVYIIIWLLAAFFSGAYDKPYRPQRLAKGIFVGTFVIAILYAFAPLEIRFSRAIILLGTAWALIVTLLWRYLFRNIFVGAHTAIDQDHKILFIADKAEATRVMDLLINYKIKFENIGIIHPHETIAKDPYISTLQNLTEIIEIGKVSEIIFCTKNIATQSIMAIMAQIGNKVNYKIVSADGLSIIGSNNKNSAGNFYSVDFNFSISSTFGKRNKYMIDLVIAFCSILFFPILIFSNKRKQIYANIIPVVLNMKTWVGYSIGTNEALENLPKIRPGVFTTTDAINFRADEATVNHINLLYAKNYNAWEDLHMIWKIIWHN